MRITVKTIQTTNPCYCTVGLLFLLTCPQPPFSLYSLQPLHFINNTYLTPYLYTLVHSLSPTFFLRVRSQVSPCDIWGKNKWHWKRPFSEYFGFPLAVSSHQSSTPIHLLSTVYILKFLAQSPNDSLLPPPLLLKMSRKRKRNLAVELKALRICQTDAGDQPAFLPARCTHEESDEGHSRSRWCVPQRACKWYRSRQFISLLGIATL
jgi:hypothetical protein